MAERFIDLPFFKKGTQVYQCSSTDPAEDQFADFSHWLYTDRDSGAVLADIKGPGTIYRIWSTGNSGDSNRIKIYLDGSTKPVVNETFNSFHNHRPLRDKPQVGTGGDHYLAWWSYMPIPFSRSAKVVREGNLRPFYSITYHTYTDSKGINTFTGRENYSSLEKMWNNLEMDPKPTEGNLSESIQKNIETGDSIVIFNHEGSGYIASVRISDYPLGKDFRIRMYWDDQRTPAVDAPVKWFFGSIDNGGDLRALGVGTVGKEGYCYFPMPYWRNAKIVLINNTDSVANGLKAKIQYNTKSYPESATAYFHATANEADKPGKKYQCLKTTGHGHVIGIAKRMPAGGHACEADEIYYIDNRRFPDIYGTGEEDYSNCAWWKNLYNSYPTHGCVGNDCYYRLHYPDVLVFEEAIDMEFEAWQNYYIASLVWYYKKDEPSLTATDSLDIGNKTSEASHHFKVSGQTWKGSKTGAYPGKRIYTDSLTDDGITFSTSCEFSVALDATNAGARIRVRTDSVNFQGVSVFVDGKQVLERPWVVAKNNYVATWRDADFEIPEKYTNGKSSITIRLKQLPKYKRWTAYRYRVYSYKR